MSVRMCPVGLPKGWAVLPSSARKLGAEVRWELDGDDDYNDAFGVTTESRPRSVSRTRLCPVTAAAATNPLIVTPPIP